MPTTTTPNMGLILPTIGLEPGPTYGTDQNSSFTLVDQHNHTPGLGVQIPAGGVNGGISIAGNLNFNGFSITNAVIDASAVTISNIVNANISASAAIARSKLAAGTASQVVINDGSGNFSSEAQLAISRGGTGQATAVASFNALSPATTRGDLIYYDGSNNIRKALGATGTVLNSNGTDAGWGLLTNANIDPAAAIADSKLATSYIKADGTRALSANWNAGNFTVTAGGFSATAGTGTILMTGATNTINGIVGLVSTGAVQGLTIASNGAIAILGTQSNTNAGAGQYGEYLETLQTTSTNFGTSAQYFDAVSLPLTAGDWLITALFHSALNGAVIASDNIRIGITTTSGNSGTGISLGVNAIDYLPPTSTANSSGGVPSYRQTIASTTIYYLKASTTYTGGPPQFKCRLSAVRIR